MMQERRALSTMTLYSSTRSCVTWLQGKWCGGCVTLSVAKAPSMQCSNPKYRALPSKARVRKSLQFREAFSSDQMKAWWLE